MVFMDSSQRLRTSLRNEGSVVWNHAAIKQGDWHAWLHNEQQLQLDLIPLPFEMRQRNNISSNPEPNCSPQLQTFSRFSDACVFTCPRRTYGKLKFTALVTKIHQQENRLKSRTTTGPFTLTSTPPYPTTHPNELQANHTQRIHVGIWYLLRAQRGSHIPTLRPKYIPYSYMDPLG